MGSIRVRHGIDDLASDLAEIPVKAIRGMVGAVHKAARDGNAIASDFARESAGAHGKWYADMFDAEMLAPLEWEYGPSGHPQGEMSFEYGSRNQPPHLDLAKSADEAGAILAKETGGVVDGLFW